MTQPTSNSVPKFLLALTILTAITWTIGLLDVQYQSETKLGFETGFLGDSELWTLAGDPVNFTLTSHSIKMERVSDKHSYAMREFTLPAADKLLDRQLRVRGLITTVKKASKTKNKDVAAYMIWFQDEKNKTIQYTTIQALTGDFSEYRAERIVTVPAEAKSFVTVLINRESDGSFELTNATITLVKKTIVHKLISQTIFGLWISLVLIAVIWLVIKGSFKLGMAVGVFLALTFFGILIPDSITSNYVFPAYKFLAQALSLGHSEPLGIYYKVGHFVFFFALTLTLILNRQQLQLSVFLIIALILVFAVATEGLQLHLYNRSTRLSDVGIDISGAVLAILIGLTIQARFTLSPIHTNVDRAE